LRLEASLRLYGNDIDDTTTPLEAGLGWTVAWTVGPHLEVGDPQGEWKTLVGARPFIGRDALLRQKSAGLARRLVGLMMDDRAVPRHGSPVRHEGHEAGVVTSGSLSPTLDRTIALAYVPPIASATGTPLSVVVRGVDHPAHVVKTPFYRRSA
jgi:aminomethyltransferase